ncbi:NUDIX domain-containing protein [Streptomyces sp. NPDC045470]|uniref:NUDIX domain-containing protein n=1 Tax=Streptomyces sp. NPDC045470 TaxID=3155469 RepID=UPI003408BD16
MLVTTYGHAVDDGPAGPSTPQPEHGATAGSASQKLEILMAPPPVVQLVRSALVLNHLGEVLAVRTASAPDGTYRLPGGEPGADNADVYGLMRTVQYETGLPLAAHRVLVRDRTKGDPPTEHYVHFCGRLPGGQKLTLEGVDHFLWLAADAVAEHCGRAAGRIESALEALANGTLVERCDGVFVDERRAG